MSLSTVMNETRQVSRCPSWTSRVRSAFRLISLCDLLLLALLAGWAGSRLDLILNHGLVGGSGDEGHRLVFSYRLCHDFSGNIYSYFFHCPWPPLPYVLQAAAFRSQQAFGGGADYGTAAICSSLASFTFAVAFVYAALAMRFQRLAGLVAAILLLSMHDMTTLAVTPMAESYCTFFLSLTLLFAALPQTSRAPAALIGLALMLATQCRSETVVLSVVFAAYCLHQRGWLAAALCASIAMFPFVFKAAVNYANGFSGMSYFNLAKFYRFESSWQGNASKAFGALQTYAQAEHSFGSLLGCIVLAALCAATVRWMISTRRVIHEQRFDSAYLRLLFGAACTLSGAILLAMASSFVLPVPRYFVICHLLWTLPFAVASAAPLARLRELFGRSTGFWDGFRESPRRRLIGLLVSLTCLPVMVGSLYRGAECFQKNVISLYKEQASHIPPSVLAANAWLHQNYKKGHICYDSLLWWETFLFFHNMRNDDESTQFMVYDHPHGDWKDRLQAEPGENNVAMMQRYIEAFRPEYIVLAGPGYWGILKDIAKFSDLNEKSSYLRPLLEECEDGTLQMKNAPYWKNGASFSMTLRPAFQNEAVAIYRASYSDSVHAESASVRASMAH